MRNIIFKAKKIFILIGIAFCVILQACSSPESDGTSAGKLQFNCFNNYSENLNEVYKSFISNLESYSFETRPDACTKLTTELQKVEQDFAKCKEDADSFYSNLESKYQTDRKKADRFNKFYVQQTSMIEQENINLRSIVNGYESQIDTLIRTKIALPPQPDSERIRKDFDERLEKHSQTLEDSRSFIKMKYSKVEIMEFKVMNISKKEDLLLCDFRIIFHTKWYIIGEGYYPYNGEGRITYRLGRCSLDWECGGFHTYNIKGLGFK